MPQEQINETITTATTSAAINYSGGTGYVALQGGPGRVALEFSIDGGATWDVKQTYSVPASYDFRLGPCKVRLNVQALDDDIVAKASEY